MYLRNVSPFAVPSDLRRIIESPDGGGWNQVFHTHALRAEQVVDDELGSCRYMTLRSCPGQPFFLARFSLPWMTLFFFFHPSSSSSSSTLALFLERKDAMLANREEESRRKIEKNFGVFIFFFFVQLFFIVLLYLVIFSLEKMFEGTFLVIGGRKISIFLELEKIFIF